MDAHNRYYNPNKEEDNEEQLDNKYENSKNLTKILSKKNPSSKDLATLSMDDLAKAEKILNIKNGGVTEIHYSNPTKGKKNMIKGWVLVGASAFFGVGACSIPIAYSGGIMTNIVIHTTTGLIAGTIVLGVGAGFNLVGRVQHWYHNKNYHNND